MIERALVGCEMSGEVAGALAATGYWDEIWSADILPCEKPVMTFIAAENRWVNVHQPVPGPRVRHYQGDVRDLFKWDNAVNRVRRAEWDEHSRTHGWAGMPSAPFPPLWTLFVGFPPCDHMTQAGARYWREKDATRGGDGRMQEGRAFFIEMTKAPASHVAVENPPGILTAPKHHGFYRTPDQVIRPWMFGDPVDKRICLWLEGLPCLEADNPVEPLEKVATGGGSYRAEKGRTGRANNGHEDREGRKMRKIVRSRTSPEVARAMAVQWSRFLAGQYTNPGDER